MAHIELETTINARVGAVFEVLRAPERRPEWMAELYEVRNVTGHQQGARWDYTYKMLGRSITGTIVMRELETPHVLKLEMEDGITGTQEWRLTAVPDGTTLLRVTLDYTVPGVLLGKVADVLFIERQNERQLRTSLANLKALAEHEHAGTSTPEQPAVGGGTREGVGEAIRVLRERMGAHWIGDAEAGRGEMLRILRDELGYDKHRTKAVVDALIQMGRVRYHVAGEASGTAAVIPTALIGLGGVPSASFRPGAAAGAGYWQIGHAEE